MPPLLRLLPCVPHDAAYVDSWARKDAASSHRESLSKLRNLDILRSAALPPANGATGTAGTVAAAAAQQGWVLHPDFQLQLQVIVSRG